MCEYVGVYIVFVHGYESLSNGKVGLDIIMNGEVGRYLNVYNIFK